MRKYYRYKDSHRTVRGVKQKRCTMCERWKPESDFHVDRARTDGLKIRCKKCSSIYDRELKRKRAKKSRKYLTYKERHRLFRGVKQKLCSCCEEWKGENSFYKQRGKRDGLSDRCKECLNTRARERYQPKEGRYLRYEERHRTINGVRKKLCRKCRKWKKDSEFYKDRSEKDGLSKQCKKCTYKPV
jgi:hypothetical protein